VLNHDLVPLRGEHRFASELSEVHPGFADGSIEYCTDLLSIAWNGDAEEKPYTRTLAGALTVIKSQALVHLDLDRSIAKAPPLVSHQDPRRYGDVSQGSRVDRDRRVSFAASGTLMF
jgi:hypothetical protein